MRELCDLHSLKGALQQCLLIPLDLKGWMEQSLQSREPLMAFLLQRGVLGEEDWQGCFKKAASQPQWPLNPRNIKRENHFLWERLRQSPLAKDPTLGRLCREFQSQLALQPGLSLYAFLLEKSPSHAKPLHHLFGIQTFAYLTCGRCNYFLLLGRYYPWHQYPCLFCSASLIHSPNPPLEPSQSDLEATPHPGSVPEEGKTLPVGLVHSLERASPVQGGAGPGSSRLGRYEIRSKLGQGGMGVVYQAYDPELDRMVALKMILTQDAEKARSLERFQREVRLSASLRHPHIVPVYESGEDEGKLYYTMGYIQGQSLRQVVRERGPLPQEEALSLLIKVTQAVEYAHGKAIVHRDIKPENIMIDEEGEPLLMDFGLARRIDPEAVRLTREGAIVGSPEFMAPEQALGEKEMGYEVDLYALGGVLYFMLTGVPPFQGKESLQILMQVIEREAPLLRKTNPAASRSTEVVVAKCLEKRPADRYPNAAMLLYDLKALLQDEPIVARPPGITEKAHRWIKRHKSRAAALFCGMILLFLGGWYLWNLWNQEMIWLAKLEEAKTFQKKEEYHTAFVRYKTLLEIRPENPEAWKGLLEALANWAGSDIQKGKWKELLEVKGEAEKLARGSLSKKQKQDLAEFRKKLDKNEVAPGTFQIKIIGDDQRKKRKYYLFDGLEQKLISVEFGKIYSLYPRDYFLVSPTPTWDSYHFEMAPSEKREFEFRTVRIPRDYPNLSMSLPHARPGWRILLSPGIHKDHALITQSHLQIMGEKGAVLQGEREPVLTLVGAFDVNIQNLQVINDGEANILIQRSRQIGVISVTFGGGPFHGVKVENSKGIRIHHCHFPMSLHNNIACLYSYGIHIRGNTISTSHIAVGSIVLDTCRYIVLGDNTLKYVKAGTPIVYAGIYLVDSMMGRIFGNRIQGFLHGFAIEGNSELLSFTGNTSLENKASGLLVNSVNGWIGMENNIFRNSGQAGIMTSSSQTIKNKAPLTILNNLFYKNKAGLFASNSAALSLKENWFAKNDVALRIKPSPILPWSGLDRIPWQQKDQNTFWENPIIGILNGKKYSTLTKWRKVTKTENQSKSGINPEFTFNSLKDPIPKNWPKPLPPGSETGTIPVLMIQSSGKKKYKTWTPANTIRLLFSEEKAFYKDSIFYTPLKVRFSGTGEIRKGKLHLSSKTIGGKIGIFSSVTYGFDTIQRITVKGKVKLKKGVKGSDGTVLILENRIERGAWNKEKILIKPSDFKEGIYRLPFNYFPASRPTFFRLSLPPLKEREGLEELVLDHVEIHVKMLDGGGDLFDPRSYDGRCIQVELMDFKTGSVRQSLKGGDLEDGVLRLEPGKPYDLRFTLWNLGKATWRNEGGDKVHFIWKGKDLGFWYLFSLPERERENLNKGVISTAFRKRLKEAGHHLFPKAKIGEERGHPSWVSRRWAIQGGPDNTSLTLDLQGKKIYVYKWTWCHLPSLTEMVSPLHTGTITYRLPPYSGGQEFALLWRLFIEHPTMKGHKDFGEPLKMRVVVKGK